jgi:tripeptide aminopeptidase
MATSNSNPSTTADNLEPDAAKALDLAIRLMAIRGRSGEEGKVVELIKSELLAAGAQAGDITTDDAPSRSPLGGEVGNLIFKLPGTIAGQRRLLMAHMDTVPLCIGCKPVVVGEYVESADKATGLGADDRGGCAVVLTAALEILRRKLPHPPLTFFWPVQEEVGLFGARFANLELLGKPGLAFNWDGGSASKITVGATGAFRIEIKITGLAAHAGNAPEKGVSAITIASLAIAKLHQHGWLGLIERDGYRGTSNVGVVRGGEATNVITDSVTLRAECRAHNPEFRQLILDTMCEAFRNAADEVRSVDGATGSVAIQQRLDYESFELKEDEPCVATAERAVQSAGLTPLRAISNGGLDANWLSAHGIPTVTMGCGQMDVHTNKERLDIEQFRAACRVALRLATGA